MLHNCLFEHGVCQNSIYDNIVKSDVLIYINNDLILMKPCLTDFTMDLRIYIKHIYK